MSITRQSWARDLLKRLGYPVTANNMTSVLAWEYAEGGHFLNSARWNPLNTTMAHATYGSINSAGVATYPNYETGMRETIATIKLPYYSDIRAHLKRSASPTSTAAAIAASPWGTWHGASASSRNAIVSRAHHDVIAHPSWYHKTPPAKHPSGGHPKRGRVVLDLEEFPRLSRLFDDATDQVRTSKARLQSLAATIAPAAAKLPDPLLARQIMDGLARLTEDPYRGGMDWLAGHLQAQSVYATNVKRAAEQADANHDGKWSKLEAKAFIAKHRTHHLPAQGTVMTALAGGTIVRRWRDLPGPAPSSHTQRVNKMLALAEKQHFQEHNGDNMTPYGAWFGDNGQPWCAMFVSWVFAHSGNPLPHIQGPHGFAYVPYAIDYARAHHQLHTSPHVGDIFLYRDGEHTGIVSKVYPDGHFDTVEGNWGNQVAHVHRNAHDGIYYFWSAIR